jgi:diguanylate cyclase (GGDEF)-like protein
MSADLKQINQKVYDASNTINYKSKLSKTIVSLYIFTIVATALGTWFALYQNWTVRMQGVKSRLVLSANMGDFLVETQLNSAAKLLDTTQASFAKEIQSGHMNRQLATQLLNSNYKNFKNYTKTDAFGLLFFVDQRGMMYAQVGGDADKNINFSDRFYFYTLRDNPKIKRTLGPLVLARTTGQWVFHMSVPVYGEHGEFVGALVQQILEKEMVKKITTYADINDFEQMVVHFDGNGPSFLFPPSDESAAPSKEFLRALTHEKIKLSDNDDSLYWSTTHADRPNRLLLGYVKSSTYNSNTYVTMPTAKIKQDFVKGNLSLMVYSFFSMIFVTAIFYYLYNLAIHLTKVEIQSLHDPLTGLHNRRALDELLPALLRESMRTQVPISVLFIDIDHFRYFNENFGHESGDIALKAVADAVSLCVRRPLDIVCRWGGEEFVVILPQTNRYAAQKIAKNILTSVSKTHLQGTNGQQPQLTVSVGHVTAIITTDPVQIDLVDEADKAMLQAKAQGRNQCVEYTRSA